MGCGLRRRSAGARAMREHQREQFGNVLRVADDLQAQMGTMTDAEKARFAKQQPTRSGRDPGPFLTHEQLKKVVAQPLQEIMFPMLIAELKAFAAVEIKVGILYHDHGTDFVTSDNPCVWFDPATANAPPIYRGVGLGSPTVEVTLPIGPKATLILSRNDQLEGYVPISELFVHELNRRTVLHCDKEVISAHEEPNPYWFMGTRRALAALLAAT